MLQVRRARHVRGQMAREDDFRASLGKRDDFFKCRQRNVFARRNEERAIVATANDQAGGGPGLLKLRVGNVVECETALP